MQTPHRVPSGPRGRTGAAAEAAAATWLRAQGWLVLARNVRVAGVELDLLARDPGSALVVVEVRARSGPGFGAGVESVDARKVTRLYRAAVRIGRTGLPAAGVEPRRSPPRVDLLVLRRGGGTSWRVETHLRGLEPP